MGKGIKVFLKSIFEMFNEYNRYSNSILPNSEIYEKLSMRLIVRWVNLL